MALRTSSSAVGASAISPLRTPRERDCPRPTMFNAPAAFTSPTAAQTFDVPISRPTINDEAGSNIFSPVVLLRLLLCVFVGGARAWRQYRGVSPFQGNVFRHGQIHPRDRLVRPAALVEDQ